MLYCIRSSQKRKKNKTKNKTKQKRPRINNHYLKTFPGCLLNICQLWAFIQSTNTSYRWGMNQWKIENKQYWTNNFALNRLFCFWYFHSFVLFLCILTQSYKVQSLWVMKCVLWKVWHLLCSHSFTLQWGVWQLKSKIEKCHNKLTWMMDISILHKTESIQYVCLQQLVYWKAKLTRWIHL